MVLGSSWTIYVYATTGPPGRRRARQPLRPGGRPHAGPVVRADPRRVGVFLFLRARVRRLWIAARASSPWSSRCCTGAARPSPTTTTSAGHRPDGRRRRRAPTPPPGVHIPRPSFRPLLVALGLGMLFLGLVVGGWILLVGSSLSIVTAARLAARRAAGVPRQVVEADHTGHLENLPAPRGRRRPVAIAILVVVAGRPRPGGLLPIGQRRGAAGEVRAVGRRGRSAERPRPGRRRRRRPAADVKFDLTTISAPAGQPFTIALRQPGRRRRTTSTSTTEGGAKVFHGRDVTGPGSRRTTSRRSSRHLHVRVLDPPEHDGDAHRAVAWPSQPWSTAAFPPRRPSSSPWSRRDDARGHRDRRLDAGRRQRPIAKASRCPRSAARRSTASRSTSPTCVDGRSSSTSGVPSCVPCRTEFPLLKAKLEEHADDGPRRRRRPDGRHAATARAFIAEQGATWDTVDDPDGAIKSAYRVVARPQSYFIDRDGILRSIQIGEVRTPTSSASTRLIAAARDRRRGADRAVRAPGGDRGRRAPRNATAAGRSLDGVSFRVAAGETFALLGPERRRQDDDRRDPRGLPAADAGVVRVLDADPAGGGATTGRGSG